MDLNDVFQERAPPQVAALPELKLMASTAALFVLALTVISPTARTCIPDWLSMAALVLLVDSVLPVRVNLPPAVIMGA